MEISRTINTPIRNFKEAISVCINRQSAIGEIARRFQYPFYGRRVGGCLVRCR